ncbi:hypothetical protein HF521_003427 [Silurus meridionalis]|uniref:40S ribosomal protein S8 n=1 Tax=Silurus meridionalis TaxID=175797 RepID=A0A8T0B5L4_SILME|nr:hypothetical protein HF521_003427 [Silurus meridionalis]
MGISRDNWHKRRKTGGKRKPVHKKRKYELGRPPSNTKLGPKRIHTVRVRGGNKKYRALRLDVGNFSWGSECCTRKTRIIDVVYNASNNELVRTKTLVKNCVILVDSAPFRHWYESHYALPLGRKKGAKLTPEEEDILNKKRSRKVQKKFDKRRKNSKINSLLDEQFQQGKLLVYQSGCNSGIHFRCRSDVYNVRRLLSGSSPWSRLPVLVSVRMGTPIKDVVIKPDAPNTLLLEKHADYIAVYGSKKDDYILTLYDSIKVINVDKVVEYVRGLQQDDGSFAGDKWGEIDTRFSFCAVATLALLGRLDAVDMDKSVQFVLSCMNFDGGFGCRPGSESHAGQIYCCTGFLSITGQLHQVNADLLGWWLCERQLPSGGLNGRPEKLPDVCYSWWVLAALKIIGRIQWIDKAKLRTFILACQDEETGGFADRPGDMVDPFHTLFGIAGLSLLGYEQIKAVNPVFCMPEDVLQRIGLHTDLLT